MTSMRTAIGLAATAAALSGCASLDGGSSGQSSFVKLPTIDSVAAISVSTNEKPVGSATEVYARVARGANQCWFGADGPLKKDYVYHADADAPSRGGKAEIVLHERDRSKPNPRGPKAYRIKIDPVGEQATLQTENLKMSESMAASLAGDVSRWSKGEHGCVGATTAVGWSPQADQQPKDAQPPPKVASAKKKNSKKSGAALKPSAP
jgi:hypothetical protein